MRVLALLSALVLAGLATPAGARTADGGAADPRARVAVVVVTLDQIRQIQARYGRSMLAALGDARWGQLDLADAAVSAEVFESCEENRADDQLDYCVRFYLTRAELPADAPATVVVAFDDRAPGARDRQGGEMRVTCYGRGVIPADADAQDTWLWPGSVRMHGVNAMNRDRDALAACITAAASEPFTGLRQPDLD